LVNTCWLQLTKTSDAKQNINHLVIFIISKIFKIRRTLKRRKINSAAPLRGLGSLRRGRDRKEKERTGSFAYSLDSEIYENVGREIFN
jgi:hypothetical protein